MAVLQETAPVVDKFHLYIGGEEVDTAEYDEVRLPYDGSLVAMVARAAPQHVDRAIAAAEQGAKTMAGLANHARADLLLRLAEEIKVDAPQLARLICSESGKPLKEAETEATRSVNTLTAAAHEARCLHGEVVPMDFAPGGEGRLAMTVREPLGIIGAITPFNFPLNLTLHKLAPALASGNAVVHKPAERTPRTALRLAELVGRAGAPAGAYNVITGDGPALAGILLRDPRIRMITFTGSMRVGEEIRSKAGLKKVTLELGNNAPVIVEPDADLDLAVSRCTVAAFSNSGQVCISLQRAFVHAGIYEDFVQRMKAAASALRIGHPYEKETDVSSLIDEKAAIRVESWLKEACDRGARIVCGGERRFATVEPTILTNVERSSRISCEEVFGPVLAVYPYEDPEGAIAEANSTPYGLQAGVFTNNLPRAFQIARKLRFGGVLINEVPAFRMDHMPYGGIKGSGLGREGPRYAIEEMTDLKLICWRT
jgi:acyl-CoA reductase-like NAD-dependent aldehyde dehydrogenase